MSWTVRKNKRKSKRGKLRYTNEKQHQKMNKINPSAENVGFIKIFIIRIRNIILLCFCLSFFKYFFIFFCFVELIFAHENASYIVCKLSCHKNDKQHMSEWQMWNYCNEFIRWCESESFGKMKICRFNKIHFIYFICFHAYDVFKNYYYKCMYKIVTGTDIHNKQFWNGKPCV